MSFKACRVRTSKGLQLICWPHIDAAGQRLCASALYVSQCSQTAVQLPWNSACSVSTAAKPCYMSHSINKILRSHQNLAEQCVLLCSSQRGRQYRRRAGPRGWPSTCPCFCTAWGSTLLHRLQAIQRTCSTCPASASWSTPTSCPSCCRCPLPAAACLVSL